MSRRYVLPYGIGLGLNFAVQSGWNYARRITVSLPNSGTELLGADLSNNRSDTIPLLNFRLDKSFPRRAHKLTGMLDVFNLMNNAG